MGVVTKLRTRGCMAQSASALNHPNICTIYEIDEHDGQFHCDGVPRQAKLSRAPRESGPLKTDSLADLAVQIADGLSRAAKRPPS